MADDLAFLFNDPARSQAPGPAGPVGSSPARPLPHEARPLPSDIDWMTLRQAHNQTSIPISTLRKWARKGKVRARLTRVEGRDLRFVAFGDIVDRARALDRVIQPVEVVIDLRDPHEPVPPTPPAPTPSDRSHIEPVATVDSVSRTLPPVAEEPPAVTDGSILVPLEAWDRMLGQLGNLHEAGQQLADARERAAKAETEAEFLKERLRDMRKRAQEAELALDLQSESRLLPEAPPPQEPVLQIGWRRFRDRWFGK